MVGGECGEVQGLSASDRSDRAGGVALSSFHAEPARRWGVDACPRCGGQLRDDPVLVCEVRAGLRQSAASSASAPRRQMAPRRGVREDQRHHSLSVARGRPARRRARHLVQSRRNAVPATRFFRKLLKGLRYVPRVLVTDKLASYQVAARALLPSVTHRRSRYLNNRAENSHQPTRVRERVMKRFASPGQAQRFLFAFSHIRQHFRPRRHLISAPEWRTEMTKASRSGIRSLPPQRLERRSQPLPFATQSTHIDCATSIPK